MAVPPTGTFTGYAAIGENEDLEQVIYDISPQDTPFMSNISRGKASNVFHEWQTDALASATADNAAADGEDASTSTATPTVRLGNYCQIMTKTPRVSGTLRATSTAGRADEFSYQVAKAGKELKRDIESAFLSNNAATAGSATNARKLAGVGAWLWDNTVTSGTSSTTVTVTSGAPLTAPTAGTALAATETNLQSLLGLIWDDGGDPTTVMVGRFNKIAFSAFTGVATQYRESKGMKQGTILGASDMYISDFGEVSIVANRFQPVGNAYAFDMDYWEASYLRPMQNTPLAKTGDSDRSQLLTEVTLTARNPSSSGKIYTLTSS